MIKKQPLLVESLLEAEPLALELLAGEEGLSNEIKEGAVQKPGLALAGHLESLHADRVQVVGFSEISYLETLSQERAWQRVEDLCATSIPCILVTRGLDVPECMESTCGKRGLPLLRTSLSSAELIEELTIVLGANLDPSSTVHGVLVDVFGVGLLLLGKSGIGKSETALDLVMHGHRLVADDIVEIRWRNPHAVYGSGPQIIKHHMEIRGLGIINIKDLFGIASVRDTKKIEQVVQLEEWNEEEEYDRLGVDSLTHRILGVEIPLIRLPVRPGRNMSTIIEVAARNRLLKFQGHYSARDFQERLIRAIARPDHVMLRADDVE